MNLFAPFTLKWWQVSVFKVSMISFGIVIGAYWSHIFESLIALFLVFAIIGGLYIFGVWVKPQQH